MNDELARQLHDRATRGEELTPTEKAHLDACYARQDQAEDRLLAVGRESNLMAVIERGRVQGGQIVLPKPLCLPEGTEVMVQIEPVTRAGVQAGGEHFAALPFFGMWADREDMADSAAWVRKEREQWHQRATRRD